MKSLPNKSIDVKWHFISWTLITIYLCILDPVVGSLTAQVSVTFFIMINYMLVFYTTSLIVFPKYWTSRWFLLVISLTLTFLAFSLVDFLNIYYLHTALTGKNLYEQMTFTKILWPNLLAFTIPIVAGLAYFLHRLNLEKLKSQADKDRTLLLSELNFLRNQFNSHITFNFLNYCYSNVHQISEKTANAIDLFSSMLRYSLEIRPDEKVSLEREIEYIDNFIKLQRLLTTEVHVDFQCHGLIGNKTILSRILITFIENAFKHGLINSPDHPIRISINGETNSIRLNVYNRKSNKKNLLNTGIGHENVIKILELFYSKQYDLKIEQDSGYYKCKLNLSLI